MAYGARLESVLGASPQGFESPILRVGPIHKRIGQIATKVTAKTPVSPFRAVRGPFVLPRCRRRDLRELAWLARAAKSPAASGNEQGYLLGGVGLLAGLAHFEIPGGAAASP